MLTIIEHWSISQKDLNKRRSILSSEIETQHSKDVSYLKLSYRFNAIPKKSTDGCFVDVEKLILKSYVVKHNVF